MPKLTPTLDEARRIGAALRLADPHAHGILVMARRSVQGFQEDMVAVCRYRTKWKKGHRWAVVQRVGPVWSSTINLDAQVAADRAIAIARRGNAVDPAADGGGTREP